MSISIVPGTFLVGLAAVLFVATFVATRNNPQPWWVGESVVSIVVVPGILMIFVSGVLVIGANMLGGGWRTTGPLQWLEAAAIAIASVVACRVMLARLRARSDAAAVAPVIAAVAPAANEPVPPPKPVEPRKAA